jgi:hypothetical protein
MASVGPDNYVVVVLHVRDSKASGIKLVLQREPRTDTLDFMPDWFCLTMHPSTSPFASCLKKLA